MLIDSHCHLASRHFCNLNRAELVSRAVSEGVGKMVTLGSCLEDWEPTLEWAREFPGVVHACLGIHPNDAHEARDGWGDGLIKLSQECNIAAIGETGLDYYHPAPQGFDDRSFRATQQSLLEEHFELASRLGLNIVLHTRDREGTASFDDTVAIAKSYVGRVRAVFHCFIGDKAQAALIFDRLDALISITGIATFSNPGHVADVAAWCPDDRFMLETDAPYLSPVPMRGKTNEPSYLSYLGKRVAELRGVTMERLGEMTTDTAQRFFKLR